MSGSTTLEAEFLKAEGYFRFVLLMSSEDRSYQAIRMLVARINESKERVFSHSPCNEPITLKLLFLGDSAYDNPKNGLVKSRLCCDFMGRLIKKT